MPELLKRARGARLDAAQPRPVPVDGRARGGEAAGAGAGGAARGAEAAAEGTAAEVPPPQQLMRGSSFKVFDNLAKKRIAAFQTAVEEKKADAEKSEKAVEDAVDDFKDRMARFKRIEAKAAPKKGPDSKPLASVYDDNIHMQTLKNKCAAFEAAGKQTEVIAKKSGASRGRAASTPRRRSSSMPAPEKGPRPRSTFSSEHSSENA